MIIQPATPLILITLIRLVLFPHPRFSHPGAFGIPAQGQVGQFGQARVVVDRMVQAGEHRAAAVRHAVAQKLPGAVFDIV